MILSPLNQFEVVSLLPLNIFCFDFSATNLLLINILTLFLFSNIVYFLSSNEDYFKSSPLFFIPNNWQILIERLYEVVSKLLFDNINLEGEKYFPFISVIFTFILFSNLIGLIPYSFTVTSHIIVTFALSFSIFIGINMIGFQRHKANMLAFLLSFFAFYEILLMGCCTYIELTNWIDSEVLNVDWGFMFDRI